MQSDGDAAGSDAASNAVQADRVPWARLSACAGVYTAPTALVVAPVLADARVHPGARNGDGNTALSKVSAGTPNP